MISYRPTTDWPYKISAGGVVFRINEDGQREYALLYRESDSRSHEYGNSYHLPKGTMEPGETPEDTALREIKEESGLTVEILAYLGARQWAYGMDVEHPTNTTVHYFLTRYVSGSKEGMDDEHDDVRWCMAEKAMELLARIKKKQEQVIIERAEQWFEIHSSR